MGSGDGSDPGIGLAPEAVEEADFATVRRGYEPESVRTRLRGAAKEIRRLNTLVGSLSDRITELEGTPPETLESRRVAEALGDEAARVLKSATDAAQVRIEHAEAEHARIVGEAEAAAVAIAEQGRQQGRSIVAEARNVRERILADLAAKRHEHRVGVEQLRVMHDRLLEALGIFRKGLEGWIEELVQAEPRAAAAAEQAGLRVAAQPESTVSEIEAEIATARLAGVPLDAGPDETADTGEDAESGAVSEAAPEQPEPRVQAGSADAAEVRLYDVEAEADAEFDARTDPLEGDALGVGDVGPLAGTGVPDTGAEASPASEAEAIFARLRSITEQPVGAPLEPSPDDTAAAGDGTTPPAMDATVHESDGAVDEFADESGGAVEQGVVESGGAVEQGAVEQGAVESGGAVEQFADESGGAVDEFADESGGAVEQFADESEQFAEKSGGAVEEFADESDEFAGEFADELGAATEPADDDDLVSAARAVAVGGIARRLKRLVVDEQGDLLDAIRRTGVRAVRSSITSDTTSYTRSPRVPMQDFASDIDVSIDDIDLKAAGAAILPILVEPVRSRLGDLLEDTDDPDELSSAVRSIYRESRSRRADAAAEAAFSAGWPEPIT